MLYITLPDKRVRRLSFYLAMEEYVAKHVKADDCFFMWQVEPSVIFGRNQLIENEVNLEFCRKHNIQTYRRKSGGGCVYADMNNVMFSYITSEEQVGFTFNRYINMVVHTLQRLGVDASPSGRNDVMIGDKKVSGNAFYKIPGRSMDFLKNHISLSLPEFMAFVHDHLCDEDYMLRENDVQQIERMEQEYLSDEFIYGKNPHYTIIKKRRIEDVGDFEARIELKNGIIKNVNLMGDYFLIGDLDEGLLNKLKGVPLEAEAISCILPDRIDDIIMNLLNPPAKPNTSIIMENKKTCLYDKHVALGALISPFGGFDMPIQYTNIIDEHQAVRQHCGVFDVSHMGEVLVSGKDAERYVNHVFTNDVRNIPNGKILYGMMCYEDGGVVDDLLVYKMADDKFFLVINAANIDKDWAWIQQQSKGFDITLDHQSDQYGELAIQGPDAEQVMEQVLGVPCKELVFYTFKTIDGIMVSRTGYTGEDGFEIYAAPDAIRTYWDQLMAANIKPCGLGCRDTLRFEVGLPLYGDELSESITPIMAGLGIFVKLDKEEFTTRLSPVMAMPSSKTVTSSVR